MTQTAAFAAFLARSGLPVYAEGEVPEDPGGAYITFAASEGVWEQSLALHADLWLTGGEQRGINALARAVLRRLGRGGKLLPCDGGAVWLLPGQPPFTALTDETEYGLRRRRLNFTAIIFTDDAGEENNT